MILIKSIYEIIVAEAPALVNGVFAPPEWLVLVFAANFPGKARQSMLFSPKQASRSFFALNNLTDA
jgi:hypothetical protein